MAITVKLRGTSSGLVLSLSGEGGFEEARRAMRSVLRERQPFLDGAGVVLDCGNLALETEELRVVIDECASAGLDVVAVVCANESTRACAQGLGFPMRAESGSHGDNEDKRGGHPAAVDVAEGQCAVVTGVVRSGTSVRHSGTVVVFGDVNAGAEIVAGGSVVVWGRLRGTVHAGAAGDEKAVVCALQLEPTQLRIGSSIARAPDEPGSDRGPEVARVQDGLIVVDAWPARRGVRTLIAANGIGATINGWGAVVARSIRRWLRL